MRSAFIILIFAAAAFAAYWMMLRPVLRQWRAFDEFYRALDAVEATLWFRIRMALKGLKTQLLSALLIIAPTLLAILQAIQALDLHTIITALTPDRYDYLVPAFVAMIFPALGALQLYLRSISNTPMGSPVPEAPPESPTTPVAIEVPTVESKPDAVVVVEGPKVEDIKLKE